MPVFYLHIHAGNRIFPDRHGMTADIQKAREEARRVIRELVADEVWSLDLDKGNFIQIVDELGEERELVALWEVAIEHRSPR